MSNEDNSAIDQAVLALLREHVDTFEKLELVLAMARDPNASWTLDGLAAELRLPHPDLVAAIDHLRAAGILRRIPGATYRLTYSPVAELAPACLSLRRAYDQDRAGVIRRLRAIEIARATRSSAEAFADAFRIRKRVPEEGDE